MQVLFGRYILTLSHVEGVQHFTLLYHSAKVSISQSAHTFYLYLRQCLHYLLRVSDFDGDITNAPVLQRVRTCKTVINRWSLNLRIPPEFTTRNEEIAFRPRNRKFRCVSPGAPVGKRTHRRFRGLKSRHLAVTVHEPAAITVYNHLPTLVLTKMPLKTIPPRTRNACFGTSEARAVATGELGGIGGNVLPDGSWSFLNRDVGGNCNKMVGARRIQYRDVPCDVYWLPFRD